jgi:aryl-alcohol dehydrogenase-like predicted oxidoreductase
MAEALGLGVALWSPLAGGLLTGKYRVSDAGRLTDWQRLVHTEDSAQKTAVVDELLTVADELGAPPAQVAVAWLRHLRSATTLIPIIGPRTSAQLEDYLAALDLELSEEHVERLARVSAVAPGVPHEVIARVNAATEVRPPAVPVA